MAEDVTAAKHEAYASIHRGEDFTELRRRFRAFVVPATVAFMAWYLLYVIMSSFAGDFMSTKITGNINVALVFGLLQFASTFIIAVMYSRYASARLDPIADKLRAEYEEGADR